MRFRVRRGSPIIQAEIELWSPRSGQRSIGHNLITYDGLKSAGTMMFMPVKDGTKEGFDLNPNVDNPSRQRSFGWVLLGTGVDAPNPSRNALGNYLTNSDTKGGGACGQIMPYASYEGVAGWSRMVALANGWRWSAMCIIEWNVGSGGEVVVKEWCIANSEYNGQIGFHMLNHGAIDHNLDGETECTVRVSATW